MVDKEIAEQIRNSRLNLGPATPPPRPLRAGSQPSKRNRYLAGAAAVGGSALKAGAAAAQEYEEEDNDEYPIDGQPEQFGDYEEENPLEEEEEDEEEEDEGLSIFP